MSEPAESAVAHPDTLPVNAGPAAGPAAGPDNAGTDGTVTPDFIRVANELDGLPFLSRVCLCVAHTLKYVLDMREPVHEALMYLSAGEQNDRQVTAQGSVLANGGVVPGHTAAEFNAMIEQLEPSSAPLARRRLSDASLDSTVSANSGSAPASSGGSTSKPYKSRHFIRNIFGRLLLSWSASDPAMFKDAAATFSNPNQPVPSYKPLTHMPEVVQQQLHGIVPALPVPFTLDHDPSTASPSSPPVPATPSAAEPIFPSTSHDADENTSLFIRARVCSPPGGDAIDIQGGAVFENFFSPASLIVFCRAVIKAWSRAPAALIRATAQLQFPNVWRGLGQVFDMSRVSVAEDDAAVATHPPSQPWRMRLFVPLDHVQLVRVYPQMAQLFKWLAQIDIRVQDADAAVTMGEAAPTIARFEFDATHQAFIVRALCSDDGELLWTNPSGEPIPARKASGLAALTATASKYRAFEFNLGNESRLAITIDVAASLLGVTSVSLPRMHFLIGCQHDTLQVQLSNITSPWRIVNWILNLNRFFARLIDSTFVDVVLRPRPDSKHASKPLEESQPSPRVFTDAGPGYYIRFAGVTEMPTLFMVRIFAQVWHRVIKKKTYIELLYMASRLLLAIARDVDEAQRKRAVASSSSLPSH
ncbi:hypothetical protein CAOG_04780 [Capsaspora owczarzaki ATCC 30864]|uniref:Uncharacterized protein n=1 Tax=Capsaspora owczarzaki (strain ATCC 30864) TaxID=595528 RepID=A0A0D2WRY4_CAPO3|nr:hypothetical protein CAOG_04780 [Capsaspora owczarzaki ATCC 30864]KJE94088.1 hypothetical protein CAOG_004780 [Capsaspora owczarzaki ATCC 30864]|eukprot:XP_004347531.1 hypothetical protein CAOG_04780 [Capsaspora owczarzaki ATCC 30864]